MNHIRMKAVSSIILSLLLTITANAETKAKKKAVPSQTKTSAGAPLGFPSAKAAQDARNTSDLNRAIQAYRFFYPTVSGMAIIKGNTDSGLVENKVFGVLDTQPKQTILTANSDTPYGPIPMNLSVGPMVIEMPPGPLICVVMDVNQRWVADMGLPGPDAGKGGKHLILPLDYKGEVPAGYHAWKATSNRLIVGIRSLPVNGDVNGAIEKIKTIKVHPLNKVADWTEPKWVNLTGTVQDTTPLKWENNIKYWEVLHEVVDSEPVYSGYRNYYGELAALGIEKGKPFNPDARMKRILEQAAKTALNQMKAEAFADQRPDRVVWPDRKWEWAALRFEDGNFDNPNGYTDLVARDKWFYQAIGASPAMFKRDETAGSLYWLGLRDSKDTYLDGGKTYRLVVPQRVPGKLFWSVTVYDAETRSQVQTDQNKAALRSMFELKDIAAEAQAELYFGPKAPAGKENQWIKTLPGKGWFAYFRIYGPEKAAFDGTWKPGDFEEVKTPLAEKARTLPVADAETANP